MKADLSVATPGPAMTAPSRSSWLRPKYILAACIALMYVYVIVHNESFLVDRTDPEWGHIELFKWLLLPHGLAAGCALLLGPLQFSERLRRRFTKAHRIMGRFYVGGVLIGAPLGYYIQHFEEVRSIPASPMDHSLTIATIFDAAVWMVCTIVALTFILQGKVQLHRQWMTRSFACAIIFLEVRVIQGVFNWYRYTDLIVWGCVVAAVPLADLLLQLQEQLRTRAAASVKKAQLVGAD